MANKSIPQLPTLPSEVEATDLFHIVRNNTDYKADRALALGVKAIISSCEIDFGVNGAYDGIFTVADSNMLLDAPVICNLAIKTPSDGSDADKAVWESEIMQLNAQALNGQLKIYVKNRLGGKFFGKFVINYSVNF
jgi:hypothetical protein